MSQPVTEARDIRERFFPKPLKHLWPEFIVIIAQLWNLAWEENRGSLSLAYGKRAIGPNIGHGRAIATRHFHDHGKETYWFAISYDPRVLKPSERAKLRNLEGPWRDFWSRRGKDLWRYDYPGFEQMVYMGFSMEQLRDIWRTAQPAMISFSRIAAKDRSSYPYGHRADALRFINSELRRFGFLRLHPI